MRLSQRALQLTPSLTLAISAEAKLLRSQGHDVINMSAGELNQLPPPHVLAAVQQAIEAGHTKYTPAAGILPLREAVLDKLKQTHNCDYQPSQVTVTVGAKQALYNAFQVILDPGDEVIVPAPYWVSYIEQIKLAGGVPVIVPTSTEQRFLLDPEALQASITSRTKALILNTPSNPTGTVYPRDRLAALAEVCLDHNVLIISDEIYAELIHAKNVQHTSPLDLGEEVARQTLWIHGVSKAYAMTGFRIGYAAGNADLITAMTRLASHSTSSPTSFAQYAALAALRGRQESVGEIRTQLATRCQLCWDTLKTLPAVQAEYPDGAFYLFVNIAACLRPGEDDLAFATRLLSEHLIATVPGTAFGMPEHLRLSYALDEAALTIALQRLKLALQPAT